MTIKPQSAKAKGRLGQQLVRDRILATYQGSLEPDDVRSTSMGAGGEDLQLSPAARKALLNTQWECKARKAFAVYKDYEQAKTHGKGEPVLVVKGDRKKPLAIVDLDFFLGLLYSHYSVMKG